MKRKIPGLVTVLILTTLTALTWVGLSIYWAITKEPSPVVPEEVSQSLEPKLDQEAISEVQGRIFLGEEQVLTPSPTSVPKEEAI